MPGKYSNVQSSRSPASGQTHFLEGRKSNANVCRRDLLKAVPRGHMTDGEQQRQRRKSPALQGAGRTEPPRESQQPSCFNWCNPGRPPCRDRGLAGAAGHRHGLSGWGRGLSDKEEEVLAHVILNTSAGGKNLLRSNPPCPEPITHKCPVIEQEGSPLPD